uniref:Tetratricopeptide repeat-containing protein n=1 Tax=Candidatus Kentrum sp. MB TaxID=2138164 RepID=A0A450Y088_9GAMM|nr:MAG: Tetratricopeptide repeat-containing protein [Candidatus Kentron sp. MB]VFK77080.1 MAG: Tetratricopeptide repeat-containing protein [Candidatus Kentron sp. MB]
MEQKRLDTSNLIIAAITALATVADVGIAWYMDKSEPDSTAIAERVASITAREVAKMILDAQEQRANKVEASVPDILIKKDQHIRELTEAVETLRKARAATEPERKKAETALQRGETHKADTILARMEKVGSHQAARAAKARGAIAYRNRPQEALEHYQRAVEYTPRDAQAWNRVGVLNHRLGTLNKAREYYRRALGLAEELDDKEKMVEILGNLGNIAQTHGELTKAEKYFQRALTLGEKLGIKADMATALTNLGSIAKTRGQQARAEKYWRRALTLFTEVDMKPQMDKISGWLQAPVAHH